MRNLLHRLRGEERGASVIEFALFAPILGVMLMGVTDLAMGYSTKLRVEAAIFRALEKVQVGSYQTDYQTFIQSGSRHRRGRPDLGGHRRKLARMQPRALRPISTAAAPPARTRRATSSVTIVTSYTPRFSYGPLVRTSNGTVPIEANASVRIQ